MGYLFPSIAIQETSSIININSKDIINTIKSEIEDNNILDNRNYLIFSVVYILAITLPLHSYLKTLELLETLSKSLSKLKYFMPHYTYVLMKTILKFYLIHKEKKIYEHFTVTNIKMFIFILINLLRKNLFLPNEEMMRILSLFFGKLIIQERGLSSHNPDKNEGKYFQIIKGNNFFIYIKYNFTRKKIFSPNVLINRAIKENKNCNINIISGKNKVIQPKIKIKIKDYVSEAELCTPKKLYKLIQSTFNDFFNENFDYKKLRIKTVRDVIINLIQFGEELNQNEKILPVSFLIYTLYFLKDI